MKANNKIAVFLMVGLIGSLLLAVNTIAGVVLFGECGNLLADIFADIGAVAFFYAEWWWYYRLRRAGKMPEVATKIINQFTKHFQQ